MLSGEFAARYGSWAVVTGASSGIGRALAEELARRGVSVLAVARRRDRLESLRAQIVSSGTAECEYVVCDLADPRFLEHLLPACAGKDIGLVACNAGVGAKGLHAQTPPEQIARVVAVNCTAAALVARAFLPRLLKRGRGGLMITGSIEGYLGFPYSATYSASKAFARSLGEAIWGETRSSGIDVLVLAPGATDTEILDAQGIARARLSGVMKPEAVAKAALDHLGRGPHFVPGAHNKMMVAAMKVLPRRLAVRLAGRAMRSALE
ncbi:MAG: SDR family NAD(P)-dependent oxidoreductase [Candidatus Dadabacteria bacterium]|nr:MAG: SDR family NAD(P)-dependent oxidoreductase [Candidatus Dadabacteria bacterium]